MVLEEGFGLGIALINNFFQLCIFFFCFFKFNLDEKIFFFLKRKKI